MIVEFNSEDDYKAARSILIEMHERNPPPKYEGRPFLFARDEFDSERFI